MLANSITLILSYCHIVIDTVICIAIYSNNLTNQIDYFLAAISY